MIVSFDFWNTLYRYESSAAERSAKRSEIVRNYGSDSDQLRHANLGDEVFEVANRTIKDAWAAGSCLRRREVASEVARELPALTTDVAADLLCRIEAAYRGAIAPRPMEGVIETVRTISSWASVAMLCDNYFVGPDTIRHVLHEDGILECFETLIFSEELRIAKPDPQGLAEIRKISPGEALVHVGDVLDRDWEVARRAGATFVWISPESPPGADSPAMQDDPLWLGEISTLRELPEVLTGLSG